MLRLDASGDLYRASGAFTQLSERDTSAGGGRDACIGQRIALRLRRWRGEWSFDTRLGMDWDALLQKGQESTLRAMLISEICRVPGVVSVQELTIVRGTGRSVALRGRVTVAATGSLVDFAATV